MSRAARIVAGVALALLLFGVGVAVGEALHDNPKPDFTVTHTKTLRP